MATLGAMTRPTNGSKLSRDEIVVAARELITEVGVEGCTMRELSSRLGVALGATYHHVPNKHELLVLVGQDIYREIADHLPDRGTWSERLKAAMVHTANTLRDHPGMAEYLLTHGEQIRPEQPNLAIYTMLSDAGFDADTISTLMMSMFLFVGGISVSWRNLTSEQAQGGGLVGLVPSDDVQRVFEDGLDMFLVGAAARLAPGHPSAKDAVAR